MALLLNRPSASGASSRVLLLEGANMEATEAAWDFAATANNRKALLDERGLSGPAAGKSYQLEVLLHTRALVGARRHQCIGRSRRLPCGFVPDPAF